MHHTLNHRALITFLTLLTLATTSSVVWGGEPSVPRVFCLSPQRLAKARAGVAAHAETLKPALERLRRDVRGALKAGPFSVVDNDLVPPSGDKHDYLSFGPYWWPDPTKKDGLPYIRRDGEVNPASRSSGSDSPAMSKMVSAVQTLALAYYFTGDEACAEHATLLLRAWFLAPATKMNPNLNFGQGIPGRVEGRSAGIIDTTSLPRVVDAVGLLSASRAWKAEDQRGMQAWFTAYLDWLRTSKHGKAEGRAGNNHGTWYDAQVACFALFAGQDRLAREVLEGSRERRITKQIEADGRQPAELARTKPFGYSIFNLQALFTLAALGERVGVDLWHFEARDGRSLRRALDFLAAYADPEKSWPYKDLKFDRSALIPLLQQAVAVYGPTYCEALAKLPQKQVSQDLAQLMYAR
jgi:hypothetical protein